MAKILLIEPYKVLQQAIALSLFPQHEVRLDESANASGIASAGGVDLLIVDAGALRELDKLSSEALRALENFPGPVLWLDEDDSRPPPDRAKLALVKKPIEKKALESALEKLLPLSDASHSSKETPAGGGTKEEEAKRSKSKRATDVPEDKSAPFIDLVEVVGEETASEKRKPHRRSR